MIQAATLTRTPPKPADDAPHLLLVDDDRRIRDLLSRFLCGEGYRVTTAMSASDARGKLNGLHFDLLILAGHHDVEDQQVEMQAEQLGAGILGAHRGGDAVALAAQKTRQQIADAAVVVDQQQMRGIVGRMRRRS